MTTTSGGGSKGASAPSYTDAQLAELAENFEKVWPNWREAQDVYAPRLVAEVQRLRALLREVRDEAVMHYPGRVCSVTCLACRIDKELGV